MAGYDDHITTVPKSTSPAQTIVPKGTSPSQTLVPKATGISSIVEKITGMVQTIVAKGTRPTTTKVPKPYSEDPNVLWTQLMVAILTEDGSGILAEVG